MTTNSDRPAFQPLPGGLVRTTYDMLLYGFPDADAEPPLRPGSLVRVGARRYRVLQPEPETATVLLAACGLSWRHWLRGLALGAAEWLGRWAAMGDVEE